MRGTSALEITSLIPCFKVRIAAGIDNLELERGRDILDIWFDSGASWCCAVDPEDVPVDLVVEGEDQFRGWFYSLLVTGAAALGRAPYRQILVHGFAVDEEGRKMSKSQGNVVHPLEVSGNLSETLAHLAESSTHHP